MVAFPIVQLNSIVTPWTQLMNALVFQTPHSQFATEAFCCKCVAQIQLTPNDIFKVIFSDFKRPKSAVAPQ